MSRMRVCSKYLPEALKWVPNLSPLKPEASTPLAQSISQFDAIHIVAWAKMVCNHEGKGFSFSFFFF